MKAQHFFWLICLSILTTKLFAQNSNMVIFTQENQPFTVIMNGIQQNPDPETNVRITSLNAPSYKVKILFQQPGLKEIDKTVYMQPERETTYNILKNNKGTWVMRMMNVTPLDEVTEPAESKGTYEYSPTPRVHSTTSTQTTTISTVLPGGTTISTSTTQTTTDVNANHQRTGGNSYDQEGGHVRTEGGHLHEDDNHLRQDYPDYADYSGRQGCKRPMSRSRFDQAVKSISSKDFESSKLTIAKQVISSNCLLSIQVKEVMKLFTFEASKLEFAKYAYKYTWDLNNYFMLNDAFDFESSIDDLNRYINSLK